jgi:peptidoglycan hydrolase-like protein with peptidoglycan-binding domain
MPQTVQMGSQGDDVRHLQEALVAQGYYLGSVDGHFGEKTAAALAYFQSTNGMHIDAVAGQQTYDYLGIADQHDSVHIELPAVDVINAAGNYTVHVMGTAARDGVRVVAWFRGANGDHHAEATVTLAPNQHVEAAIPIPNEVVQATGEYHVLVQAFAGPESIGEQAGMVHVHHEGQAATH